MDRQGSFINGTHADERTITDTLSDIVSSIQQIVRSEVRLARIELTDAARQAKSSAVLLVGGGILGLFGLGFLLLAVMFGIAVALPLWLSALIVGIVLAICGAAALAGGRRLLKAIRPPRDTIQTVKEDLQWMKEQPR